jgi:hypothetical protein
MFHAFVRAYLVLPETAFRNAIAVDIRNIFLFILHNKNNSYYFVFIIIFDILFHDDLDYYNIFYFYK